jgi:signal transduction histidine kinase
MPQWLAKALEQSSDFMPHGHCYLWLPGILWMHVVSDFLIGTAYIGISTILYLLVRRIRLPFSPVFVAFGLFIALCGMTHFMGIWTVWYPDYLLDGIVKSATALASVATAIGLVYIRPQVEEVVHAARLSEERRIRLESAHAELEVLYAKVKQLDEARTRFFSNVSHELRTPLTLILGPAERMLESDALTAEQRRQLTSISRNGKSLLKQVNDLLDVSKLEAGHMKAHYMRFDVVPWFRRISAQFEDAAIERRIAFEVRAPHALIAEADPEMLERVFGNLLSNAFKFVPAGGVVTASLEAEESSLQFAVSDNGPGISDEQQARIFERFQQGDAGASRQGGTGLGLAIAREFVELHQGTITLKSVQGRGASFIVRLPNNAPAGMEVQDSTKSEGADGGHWNEHATSHRVWSDGPERALPDLAADPEHLHLPFVAGLPNVLVVEDNHELRLFITDTLAGICNVVTAVDGREGFERAQALQPDLIITDIMMPRMTGDQLVQAVRETKALDHTPLLLLSARADDDQRISLLEAGAQDYVTKPFMPQELRARVKNLLSLKLTADALRNELASASGDVVQLARDLGIRSRQLQLALDTADVAREQAERANAVKGQFLGMISHEMRTPLTTIRLNADLLSHAGGKGPIAADLQEMDTAPQRLERLERLKRAANQMFELVEGMLQYVRVDGSRISIRPEEIDLPTLVQEVVNSHAAEAKEGVSVVAEPPSSPLPPIECDARLLRVVVSNLVSNALKFTHSGSVTSRVEWQVDWHFIHVLDTGIGIPEADLGRIFLPFEQLEPVRRKSIPGVGLGLSLAKEILDSFGGNIEVISTPGQGSSFCIRLPSRMQLHKPIPKRSGTSSDVQ